VLKTVKHYTISILTLDGLKTKQLSLSLTNHLGSPGPVCKSSGSVVLVGSVALYGTVTLLGPVTLLYVTLIDIVALTGSVILLSVALPRDAVRRIELITEIAIQQPFIGIWQPRGWITQ